MRWLNNGEQKKQPNNYNYYELRNATNVYVNILAESWLLIYRLDELQHHRRMH